jgi:4-amino-4-deoxy-L-arabinose transferase-like glycosyltransferase
MSVMPATAVAPQRRALAVPTLAVPLSLYGVALIVRVLAAAGVTFPFNEGSAYYVAVARNLAAGRGPVIDSIWSYATPPLALPGKPAFELWQPLASVLAAWPMTVFGLGFASAQLGFAVVGALLAPLAWLVARDVARRLELPDNRQSYVALGAGLLAAVAGPFVLSAAIPDSTLPFTVLAVAACIAMPAAANGNSRALLALGLMLGLAYLTRMEAAYLGVVFVVLAWHAGVRGKPLVGRLGAVAIIGAVVAVPWWLRNVAVFGTPLPGQLADNAFLTSNEQIFDFGARPTFAEFVAQGGVTILTHIVQALWHDFVDVLLLPGNFIVVGALLTIAFGWRKRAAIGGSALGALLAYGALAFVITSVLFPVATLWGTFEHAAGPLLVGFAVVAMLGGDAFVARVRAWRNWPRPNAGMAPAALAGVVVAFTVLQLVLTATQAGGRERQMTAVADALSTAGLAGDAPVITDRPIWLSEALGASTLALPAQDAAVIQALASTFHSPLVVLVDGMPSQPAFEPPTARCFSALPVAPPEPAPKLVVLQIAETCR